MPKRSPLKLTKRIVERLKAKDKDAIFWDSALAGFGVRVTASLKEVVAMRPDRTEIIICTGLRTRGGVQKWGSIATSLMCDRKQRG